MTDTDMIALRRVSDDYEAGRRDGLIERDAKHSTTLARVMDAWALAEMVLRAVERAGDTTLINGAPEEAKASIVEILAPHLRSPEEERVLEAARAYRDACVAHEEVLTRTRGGMGGGLLSESDQEDMRATRKAAASMADAARAMVKR